MAQIVKRKNKNGSTSYLFRVSTGYDRNGKQVTTSRTFTPPPTLTGRKLEKEVQRQAVEFEKAVHGGLALNADMKLDDLIDRWFSEYIDKKCKPKTGVEYRYLRPRISAALGHMTMLRAAGYGVCMGNGREDVKRMGFAVCGTNQEDGVARYIQRILFD